MVWEEVRKKSQVLMVEELAGSDGGPANRGGLAGVPKKIQEGSMSSRSNSDIHLQSVSARCADPPGHTLTPVKVRSCQDRAISMALQATFTGRQGLPRVGGPTSSPYAMGNADGLDPLGTDVLETSSNVLGRISVRIYPEGAAGEWARDFDEWGDFQRSGEVQTAIRAAGWVLAQRAM